MGTENDFRLQRLRKISIMQVGNSTNISTEHFQDTSQCYRYLKKKTWLLRFHVGPRKCV